MRGILKQIEALSAQVSPFDKGRTYQTVMRPLPPQKPWPINEFPTLPSTLTTRNLPTIGRGGRIMNQPAGSSVLRFVGGPPLYDPTGQGVRNVGWETGGRFPIRYAAIPYDESAKPKYMSPLPLYTKGR